MSRTKNYKITLAACYTGYINQAVVVNLAPLLFLIFRERFGISYAQIGMLTLANFVTQLTTDFVAAFTVDKIGYRRAAITSQLLAFAGLVLISVLPNIMPQPYTGLIIATLLYAVGGGLMEVIISPVAASVPSMKSAGKMNILHSFYSWGQVIVVLLTTAALKIAGADLWYYIPAAWAVIPLINVAMFSIAPIMQPVSESMRTPAKKLFQNKSFLVFLVLMTCAGASELAMSQWASLFAEKGLGVTKMVGDILGPCLFAVFMGVGRVIYGVLDNRIDIRKHIFINSVLCALCYIITAFSLNPFISLLACAFCGFTVSLMWPGVLGVCSESFPYAGTFMFALLAVFGDIGCSVGPFLTGLVSDIVIKCEPVLRLGEGFGLSPDSVGLKCGLLITIIFPVISCLLLNKTKNTPCGDE